MNSAIFPQSLALAAISARRFGVTPAMIEAAARRRSAGDWRGACAAAAVHPHLDPRSVRHRHGAEIAALLRTDLRSLAPDLLRWHFPRARHDAGHLLTGMWVQLADYSDAGAPITLVAATPRGAPAGQRIILTLLEGSRRRVGPHPLTGHRMFWDAASAPALARLSGDLGRRATQAARQITAYQDLGQVESAWAAAGIDLRSGCSPKLAAFPVNLPVLVTEARRALPGVDRAVIRCSGTAIALSGLDRSDPGTVTADVVPFADVQGLPIVPTAAWARPVDAELLRLGLLGPQDLHPLVAAALAPGAEATKPQTSRDLLYGTVPWYETGSADADAILVRCGDERHRLSRRDGDWQPDHHDKAGREGLLSLLGGVGDPCRQAARYLSTGRHVLDLIDALVAHGRVDEALDVMREHVDASADPREYLLGDGTAFGAVLDAVRRDDLRIQIDLAGCAPAGETGFAHRAGPRIRRTSRKGASARLKKR
ncbi:hypothetical protein [Actinospica robiniae]|uniref:hypothetical protein n=1 Tax=Actinospica robiniae TaxID=304901 RepID=UPI00041E3558|nr:hypothetical protein [Actinospica robiniae]